MTCHERTDLRGRRKRFRVRVRGGENAHDAEEQETDDKRERRERPLQNSKIAVLVGYSGNAMMVI